MSRRPSVSDLAGGRERRCRRRPSVSDLTGGEENQRWRRIPSVRDLTGGEETARPGAVASTHAGNVETDTMSSTIGQRSI